MSGDIPYSFLVLVIVFGFSFWCVITLARNYESH